MKEYLLKIVIEEKVDPGHKDALRIQVDENHLNPFY